MPVDAPAVRRNLRQVPGLREESLSLLSDDDLIRRVEEMSRLKRFMERFCGDPGFREALRDSPRQALAHWQIDVGVEDACIIRDASVHADSPGVFRGELSPNLRRFRDFVIQTQGGLELIEKAASSGNPRFSAWRTRQLARLRFQFPPGGEYVVRPAVALEVSKGCSVGCWFCAISAERFGGNLAYAEGRSQWRAVLETLASAIGDAAGSGFCYWATDPLDNPDYERFASDFYDVLGVFPPTTTALPLKNPERLRSLLRLSSSRGCRLNRLSILSLKMLDRVHREFNPHELAFTEMVLQMPESLVFSNFPVTQPAAKVRAGRTFNISPGKNEAEINNSLSGTIACIIGFLLNMVERTVQLVSPCIASQDWPLGYMIFDESRFEDADHLGEVLQRMIERHMPLSPPPAAPVRFHPNLGYSALKDGFRLSTQWHSIIFRDRSSGAERLSLQTLGELIRPGNKSPKQMFDQCASRGTDQQPMQESLNHLFASGVLDEDPVPPSGHSGSSSLVWKDRDRKGLVDC